MSEQELGLTESENARSILEIHHLIDERGFYFFKWLSLDELRMAYERDYIYMIQLISPPLIVVSIIVGLVMLTVGVPQGYMYHLGTVLLGTFGLVVVALFSYMIHRSWLYINGADIIITGKYYISKKEIIEKTDRSSVNSFFNMYEAVFQKKFPGSMQIKKDDENTLTKILHTLKIVIKPVKPVDLRPHWLKKKEVKHNFLLIPEFIESFFYAIVAGTFYILGIFIVSYIGKGFTRIIGLYLDSSESLEYKIHETFENIHSISIRIKEEESFLTSCIEEAKSTNWEESLLTKISESTNALSDLIQVSYTEASNLQNMLHESRFYDVYDFGKFDTWNKIQVHEPIISMFHLMQESKILLTNNISEFNKEMKQNHGNISPMITLEQKRKRLTLQDIEETFHVVERYAQNIL